MNEISGIPQLVAIKNSMIQIASSFASFFLGHSKRID
jgi:hypothetical protein